MNSEEISAFAAYAEKKSKKKKENDKLSLGYKSKVKLKKKKLPSSSLTKTLVNIINDQKDSENVKPIEENTHNEQKNIVKSLLKAQIESIFEGCNNKTLLKNDHCDNFRKFNGTEKKKNEGNSKKLNKKKKILNGEISSKNLTCQVSQCNEEKKAAEPRKRTSIVQNSDKNKHVNTIYGDSVKMGENVLSWLLSPITLKDFFENSWEKKPMYIQRNDENFYQNICTLKDFMAALAEKDVYFTKNIDVTSYVNGERKTENPEGKATLPIVQDLISQGKSIRLLNPQTFIPNIRLLNTTLQEFFQCFVGANIYMTPAGTQGFAPHYDDIEAFVLQLEGEKHWKLYNPRCLEEVLPRESSPNFREDEIGEPILEVTLKPGDLLYFPRGFIHHAKALPDVHSLHVTVSCYQRNSWADFFEKIVPVALERAIAEDVEFRKGLPIGYLNHMGMLFSDEKSRFRNEMIRKFKELAAKMLNFSLVDAAADQMGVDFMQEALPPCLSEEEKLYGADRNVRHENKSFLEALKNHPDKNLSVKLIRATSVRLVSENGLVHLYYTTDNSLVYRENEISAAEIPLGWIPAIEHLIRSYPNFVEMKSLQVTKRDNKPGKWKRIAEFVYFLWQRGLIIFDKPHQAIYS